MLQPFFDMIERLVDEFSWRRLFLILFLIFLVVGSIGFYEWYTKHFELARIEKSIDLLSKLARLKVNADTPEGENLKPIYKGLTAQLNEVVNSTRRGLGLSVSGWKIVSGAAPWLLMAFAFLPRVLKREPNTVGGLVMVIVFACIFGMVNWWLPTYRHLWINYLATPAFLFIVPVILVLLWSKFHKT